MNSRIQYRRELKKLLPSGWGLDIIKGEGALEDSVVICPPNLNPDESIWIILNANTLAHIRDYIAAKPEDRSTVVEKMRQTL